jgi:hypothetical protein
VAETIGYCAQGGEAAVPATAIFRGPKVQASLAIFLFVTAWWLGNGALFMSEFGGGVTASFIFPIAGALWWAGYKISYPAHKSAMVIGFALLALWSFGLLAVFASYKYAPHLFFWVASATMALLITGIARIRPRPDPS